MSASNKKKLRKQEAEAQMTQRQQAASKEAKKQKTTTLTFVVVIALCLCITIGAVLTNPIKNVVYRNTDTVQVGEHTLNAVELNYFYADAVSQFYSSYSSYISYLLDTKKPLDQQVYDNTTGQTWADYFLDAAYNNIQSTYAMYDEALANGFTLSEDQKAALDSNTTYMSLYASIYSYQNVDAYLAAMYGNGATLESYTEYYEKCLIAEAYYQDYSGSLEYTPEQLSAYHNDHTGEFFSYNYATYYLAISNFYPEGAGTKGEDNKITYTDEETAAAVEAAKAVADALAAGEYADLSAFEEAIANLDINKTTTDDKDDKDDEDDEETSNEETSNDETSNDETSEEEEEVTYKYLTNNEDTLYSKVNSLFRDWIIGKVETEEEDAEPTFETRTEGELKVFEYSSGEGESKVINGYYVVRYGSINENDFTMKNVRHILVKFQQLKADGTVDSSSTDTTYSDEEKAAAKKDAEALLKQWQDGEATEDSFAELANKESDDGDGTTGGLYENIYPGQMVENFEDWCYDEAREVGDVEIIETEYGYHIMYFVGNTEMTYCDYLITETMRSEDTTAWYEALIEAVKVTKITDKYVNKSMTMG